MYCIQEFLSDNADVLVVLVDVGPRSVVRRRSLERSVSFPLSSSLQ